jgi:hypothetical protein
MEDILTKIIGVYGQNASLDTNHEHERINQLKQQTTLKQQENVARSSFL